MKTMIILNIYDLSPANDCLHPVGFGVYHSGVEILGTEYSFASGSGIFEYSPKEAPPAKFRESIELGAYEGGSGELRSVISDLRRDFGPYEYNVVTKNCNSFSNALVWSLLGRQIPSYVNRLADIGSFFSCLLPKKLIGSAPVSTAKENGSDGFRMYGRDQRESSIRKDKPENSKHSSFVGKGSKLGTPNVSSTSSTSSIYSASSALGGFVRALSVGPTSEQGGEDPCNRREKAKIAALARMQKQD